jgi:hypothetical protein
MCGCCRSPATCASSWNRCTARVDRGGGRHYFQGHAAAEGDLLGFVDDAHAAPTDLADDPEIAEDLAAVGVTLAGQ